MTTAIIEYSTTEAALAELRTKYGDANYDVATTAGMSEAKKARADLRGYRTDLEKKRVEIKAPALERCRLIDAEAKRITTELEALELPIDTKIKGEEERKEREKQRLENEKRLVLEAAQRMSNDIRAKVVEAVGRSVAEVDKQIAEVQAYTVPENDHRADVEAVREQVLGQLNGMRLKALAQEAESKRLVAERAELERLRAKAAEQEAERQRAVEEQRIKLEADAKASRERIEAEQRKAQAERDAADAKAKAERDAADAAAAKLRAEQERQARESREKEESRLRAERAKLDAERDAADALARKQAQEAEDKARAIARAEREAAEAKQREAESARIKSLTARAMLAEFVSLYGKAPEFSAISRTIEEFLSLTQKTDAKQKRAVAQ